MKFLRFPDNKLLRLASALVAFALILAATAWIGHQQLLRRGVLQTGLAMNEEKGRLFYDTIGRTPTDFLAHSNGRAEMGDLYTLELTAVRTRDEAERIIDKYARLGVESFYTPLHSEGRVIFRVRRGIFKTPELASAAAGELKKKKNLGSRVVRLQ